MAEHTMKIKAVLDTSDVQAKLNQMNQQRSTIGGSLGGGGTSELNHAVANLNRTIAGISRQLQNLSTSMAKAQSASPTYISGGGRSTGGAPMPMIISGDLFKPGRDGNYQLRQAIQIQKLQQAQAQAYQKWTIAGMRAGVGTQYQSMLLKATATGAVPSTIAPQGLLEDALMLRTLQGAGAKQSLAGGFGKLGKFALAGVAMEGFNQLKRGKAASSWQNIVGTLGAGIATGAGTGAMIGAAAGAPAGGVGAAPGAAIGAIFGAVSGLAISLVKLSGDLVAESDEQAEAMERAAKVLKQKWDKMKDIMDEIAFNAKQRDQIMNMEALIEMRSPHLGKEKTRLETEKMDLINAQRYYEKEIEARRNGSSEATLEDAQKIEKEIARLGREIALREKLLSMIDSHIAKNIAEDKVRLQQNEAERKKDISLHDARQKTIEDIQMSNNQMMTTDAITRMSETSNLDTLQKSLSRYQELLQQYQDERSDAWRRMTGAHERGDQKAYEKAEREYNIQSGNVEFAIQMKNILASGIQSLFEEMMTYQGLQIGDFGQLAALGGFGSTSVLGDPMLDINREQNRILQDILRAVKDQNMTAKYL